MIFFLRKYVPEYKKRRHLDTDGHKNYWMRKDVAFFYFTQLFFNIFCQIFTFLYPNAHFLLQIASLRQP